MIEHTLELRIPSTDGTDDFVATAKSFEVGYWEVDTNLNCKAIDANDAAELAEFFATLSHV